MLDRLFGSDSFVARVHALDAASLRQEVISNNIANVNTPNFKRQDVVFESRLAAALEKNDNPCATGESVSKVTPNIVTVNQTSTRTDGNNVDIEQENVHLAINALRYSVLVQSVTGHFRELNLVIQGR